MDQNREYEMSYATQLLTELTESGLASVKEIAHYTGLHENTVRDYAAGRIRHFGRESRFWNGVVAGMCERYKPQVPVIVYRIMGQLLKNTPLVVMEVPGPAPGKPSIDAAMRRFIPINRALTDAMETAVEIMADGQIDRLDDPNISALNTHIDQVIANALAVKVHIEHERRKANAQS